MLAIALLLADAPLTNVIAVILFLVGGGIALYRRAWDVAAIGFGLAALSWPW